VLAPAGPLGRGGYPPCLKVVSTVRIVLFIVLLLLAIGAVSRDPMPPATPENIEELRDRNAQVYSEKE
jgi:hypothetical protein